MPREDTQFKPGQSGNPGGRPKGASVYHRLCKMLAQGADAEIDPEDKADAAALAMLDKLLAGNEKLLTYLIDRQEGKTADTVRHEGGGLKVVIEPAEAPDE